MVFSPSTASVFPYKKIWKKTLDFPVAAVYQNAARANHPAYKRSPAHYAWAGLLSFTCQKDTCPCRETSVNMIKGNDEASFFFNHQKE